MQTSIHLPSNMHEQRPYEQLKRVPTSHPIVYRDCDKASFRAPIADGDDKSGDLEASDARGFYRYCRHG